MSDNRDTKLTIKVNDVEKQVVEKVSEAYDCSQSAAGRMLFSSHYTELFGEIHPEALDRHDIDMDEILRGEVDPGEIDDTLKMDGDGPAQIPASDGGPVVDVSPGSHSPTQTPTDLSTSGPALTWDELTDAIGQHWSDDLEIHPGRVEPDVLKNNLDVTPKILAGILRHHKSDAVSTPLIEQAIEDYLGHQITRADYEAGLRYKITQYEPKIREHFVSHPNESGGSQYTTPDARDRGIPHLVSLTVADLEANSSAVDFGTWRERNVEGADATIADVENWIEDLAEYRSSLETLSAVVTGKTFQDALQDSDLEHPDEYADPMHYVSSVLKERFRSYASADPFARYVAVNEMLELGDEDIRDEDLDNQAILKFEAGDQTPLSGQLAIVTKRVV